MIACSNVTVLAPPSGCSTTSWFGEANLPMPTTVVTLRCLARPESPPVSRLTTPSFQPRSLSRSTEGARRTDAVVAISAASSITLAACSSALDGMQPTLRQTPPSVGQRSTSTTFLPRSAARKAAV